MALYLHLTTTTGTTTHKVANGWFPQISGGLLVLPDGTEVEATSIMSTKLESKRETPARDAKLKAIDDAHAQLAQAQKNLGIPAGTLVHELEDYVDMAVALAKAQDDLTNHDLALVRAKESAKKARENPKPKPEPKAKAKKAPKK